MTTTIVDQEAAYLAADTNVAAVLHVVPFARRVPANAKHAQLHLDNESERRVAQGLRQKVYQFRLDIEWPITSAAVQIDAAQRSLVLAVEAVEAAVRGTSQDRSHGGLFFTTTEDRDGPLSTSFMDPTQTVTGDSPALRATVRYSAAGVPFNF